MDERSGTTSGGDRERFDALYRAHCVEILRFAAARTDADSAREVLAECFLIAWRRVGDIPVGNERAWLFAVAHRVLSNERRAGQRRMRLNEKLERLPPPTADADHAQQTVDRDAVVAALARLPALDRDVLQLIEWDGLSAAEAAQVLSCSVTALRVRLHRARRRLIDSYESTTEPAVKPAGLKPNQPLGDLI